jgi:hypothetical protein
MQKAHAHAKSNALTEQQLPVWIRFTRANRPQRLDENARAETSGCSEIFDGYSGKRRDEHGHGEGRPLTNTIFECRSSGQNVVGNAEGEEEVEGSCSSSIRWREMRNGRDDLIALIPRVSVLMLNELVTKSIA